MPREVAVAVLDVAVAATAFYSAATVDEAFGKFGFILIGLAASVGVARFASQRPSEWLVFTHTSLSWIAKLFGMPFLTAAYSDSQVHSVSSYHSILLLAAVTTFCVTKFLPKHMKQTPTDVISGLSILGIVYKSYPSRMYGVFGSLMYFLGGVILEVQIGKQHVSPIALFHYVISVANLFLMFGLKI